MTKVVLNMVTLIFQGVECFIFNFPAGSARFDQLNDICFADRLVGDPTVMIGGLVTGIKPILEEINMVRIAAPVERYLVDPSIYMLSAFIVGESEIFALAKPVEFIDPFKQHFVVGGFGYQDKSEPVMFQCVDKGLL